MSTLRRRLHHSLFLIAASAAVAQVPPGAGPGRSPQPAAPRPPQPQRENPPPPNIGNGNGNGRGNANLSAPLAGLTPAQLADFADGRLDFRQVETSASGLGPIFNRDSCAACHSAGGTGGAGRITVTHFGRTTDGVFDPLTSLGGSLLQERAIDPAVREFVPREANTVARRLTTPLFGSGLIEAIPDATIVLGTLRARPAGIGGKVSVVRDAVSGVNRIGRFGWKAQHATLLAFSGDAYRNEMGITNRLFPTENAPNGNTALLERFDRVPEVEDVIDPADGKGGIDRAADFMRLLAPPPRGPATASSLAGERIFAQIDCTGCHKPAMSTGRHAIAALSEKTVALYSDLLLHDMGALGDGIAQGTAGGRDMRTAPLWGLAARPVWLHDGRADSVDAAIRAHAGEAQDSRDRYTRLTVVEQRQLLDFLNSL
jgi:CxxC motif-containing protein (DUF1111 family)